MKPNFRKWLPLFTKDVGKAVEGNGKRQGELKRELDLLLLSYQQKERIDKIIKSPAKSSTIVSISSQTETSHSGRKKRAYENGKTKQQKLVRARNLFRTDLNNTSGRIT